jgi:2-hydroxychromene-2-carboxylate isomerase
VERLPYTLDIPSFLGRAELDDAGHDIVGTRNAHQWRRVRYSYMDCRREASRRRLILRGPRKIFDSSIAHMGFLYAVAHGNWRAFHATVYTRFWQRALDIEDAHAIAQVLAQAGVDAADFADWCAGEGRLRLARLQAEAEGRGVFGVPSWLVDGELFWGAERLPLIRERIAQRLGASVPPA